jgi:hypothetical protein
MQLVAAGRTRSSQMEALIQKLKSLSFSAFVSFFVADKDLNLLGEKTADRGISPRGQDFGFAQSRLAQTDRDILFVGILWH